MRPVARQRHELLVQPQLLAIRPLGEHDYATVHRTVGQPHGHGAGLEPAQPARRLQLELTRETLAVRGPRTHRVSVRVEVDQPLAGRSKERLERPIGDHGLACVIDDQNGIA
jgi:hypothetical protein